MPGCLAQAPKNCCKLALALSCVISTSGLWQACGAQAAKPEKLKDDQLQGVALLDRAEKYGAKDKPAKAKVLINRYLKDHPADSRALRLLGDCYFYADMEGTQHYKARQCYDRAIKLDPQNSVAYRMIAELYMVDGKFEQAALYAGQALACKQPTEFAYRTRAVAYNNLHRYNEALKDMDAFLKTHSGVGSTKAKWQMMKAGMLQDAGRYDEAIAVIKEVLAIRWIDDVALKEAQCYVKAGKPNDAINVLTSIIVKNPEDEFAYSERAKAKVSIKQYKEALKDFDKSIELSPLSSTLKARADLYDVLGMKAEAKRDRAKADEL